MQDLQAHRMAVGKCISAPTSNFCLLVRLTPTALLANIRQARCFKCLAQTGLQAWASDSKATAWQQRLNLPTDAVEERRTQATCSRVAPKGKTASTCHLGSPLGVAKQLHKK